MKYVTGILAGIFIFVAMFGFTSTNHAMAAMPGAHEQSQHAMNSDDCIIALMGLCNVDGLTMAEHHLVAYQSFLNTPASSLFMFSLALMCLGLVSLYIALLKSKQQLAFQSMYIYDRKRYSSYSDASLRQTFLHWLSLSETSPTLN